MDEGPPRPARAAVARPRFVGRSDARAALAARHHADALGDAGENRSGHLDATEVRYAANLHEAAADLRQLVDEVGRLARTPRAVSPRRARRCRSRRCCSSSRSAGGPARASRETRLELRRSAAGAGSRSPTRRCSPRRSITCSKRPCRSRTGPRGDPGGRGRRRARRAGGRATAARCPRGAGRRAARAVRASRTPACAGASAA